MIFCENCFKDIEIRAIIESIGHTGVCPICGNTSYIYDTDSDSALIGLFDRVIDVYTAEADLPQDFPRSSMGTLAECMKADWDIFNDISVDNIAKIVSSISPTMKIDFPSLFLGLVGISEKYDLAYLNEHSILRAKEWSDFVNAIKHKNRFHTNLINTEILKDFCLYIAKEISITDQRYYRGRISYNPKGYKPSEMGAPPTEKAVDGRANSAGISRLYLTDSRETTLHEIRAAEYDYITIGTFKLLEPIKVVDLRRIGCISPFASEEGDLDCTALAINRKHLNRINQEISRTMRKGDSQLDYIPTQYISDFIMSITDESGAPIFDGIEYQSAMHKDGANLTIFYPDKFKCTYCRTYEVTELKYNKKLVE